MQIKTKPSNQNFVKRRARQLVPFLIVGVVKNQRLSAEAIFTQKKNMYFAIFAKTMVDSITVRLMQISEQSLKEIDFSTRNALDCFQRERLNCHLGRIIKTIQSPIWGPVEFVASQPRSFHTPQPPSVSIMPGRQVSMSARTVSATHILTSLKQTDLLPGYKRNLNRELILKIITCDKKKEKNCNG